LLLIKETVMDDCKVSCTSAAIQVWRDAKRIKGSDELIFSLKPKRRPARRPYAGMAVVNRNVLHRTARRASRAFSLHLIVPTIDARERCPDDAGRSLVLFVCMCSCPLCLQMMYIICTRPCPIYIQPTYPYRQLGLDPGHLEPPHSKDRYSFVYT
jgi:hypothetical protein